MQDPLAFQAAKPAAALATDQQEQQLKCPRCDSTNTKFCYYNNYNLSQPRHFCKNCRRYWTKGGVLRNIPVGGGSRKNSKRSSADSPAASNPKRPTPPPASDPAPVLKPEPVPAMYPAPIDPDDKMLEITGSFSSLLQSSGHFAANLNFLDGFDSAGSSDSGVLTRTGETPTPTPDPHSQQQPENFLGWVGGWPDLAIYTSPGSNIQ